MEDIKLFTSSGHYVATVRIPAFGEPPPIILWGLRVFLLTSVDDGERYLETFYVAAVIQVPEPKGEAG